MKAYVFPGQGSQYKGMGSNLFDEFSNLTKLADDILGYSIKNLCLHDENQKLKQTEYTQPALFVVNALCYLNKVNETGKMPDFVAGHSLGEYNALFAAGVFDFETGLRLVKKRGELMGKAVNGGMAAVIGFSVQKIKHLLKENSLPVDIANDNSPTQIVISGLESDILQAQPIFEKAGAAAFIPLKVSGAFHSRYMADAKREFSDFLEGIQLKTPKIPVISNVEGMPYVRDDIKKNITMQITHQVKWTDSIRYLSAIGVQSIEEVGPGNVLTKLTQKIQKEAEPLQLNHRKEQSEPVTKITPKALGSNAFKEEYGLQYAYVTGSMYKGIASEQMVVQVGKAGMLGFYGTGGMKIESIERAIQCIQREMTNAESFGMNLLCSPDKPYIEEERIKLYLQYGINIIEAAAYISLTAPLVMYRARGVKRNQNGKVEAKNRIFAKVSRPEVAEVFLRPAPNHLLEQLTREGKISREQAELMREIPMADNITVEADSGGHTDNGSAYALMPAMIKLRDKIHAEYRYPKKVRIGSAGGIGTPEAAAAAFMLGADYIVTGSINQCTVEAGTSDAVKDLLQLANVQDTDYAPAGDMFEIGAKVQVLKKGLFFPVRANKLYDLYRNYKSIDEIDEKTRKMIEDKYFHRTFKEVYADIKKYRSPHEIERAERQPKHKMALIFKWYFGNATRLALIGDEEQKVNYQIHCGPALGAFNQWVKGSELENWRNRHVHKIGKKLITETADLLNQRYLAMVN
ncbi:ACP S-malonyltransferase [Bacillus sp. G16]|uniref:ACP S-malonyltransferase n=1 Tax=Bacillus sp. G16 TaxID=667304 RepID=UPI001E2C1A96|nr:ACP S-malonyltransferase [Bacillus sp. G16]MCE0740781.1 ACP S-malonyltransferase [Bacillus sp. G16]